MIQRIRSLVDFREGEAARVLPLSVAHGLVMAAVFVLKPVRNALFLDSLGIGQLPYVLILVALIGGVSVGLFSRLTRGVSIRRLVFGTYLFLALNLLLFRVAIPAGGAWIHYLFYVWVTIFSLMSVSLLLLLANAAFNPREARRLFSTIVIGGNAGAILGGLVTGWMVDVTGTENLLLVCAGLLVAAMVLVLRVRVDSPSRPEADGPPKGVLGTVARHPLLKYTALAAALAAVVATVVDIQFNEIVDEAFPTKDAKTAFFGSFFAYLNAFVLLFQLLGTTRVLRSFGVGPALLFLPLSLAGGSLAILMVPGLLGGILVKVGDMAFRHSVHKSASEILFLPVPSSIKQQSKVFLDTTIDNLAKGLGALLVLALTVSLGMSYRELSFVSIGLIAAWLVVMLPLRRAYVDAFRSALDRRELDPDEIRVEIQEAGSLAAIRTALGSDNERQLTYALEMLQMAPASGLEDAVGVHLTHPSGEVRRKALQVLQGASPQSLVPRIEAMVQDPDSEVRIEAIHFLCHVPDKLGRMDGYLADDDPLVRSAALGCISAHGTAADKALVTPELIESLLAEGEEGDEIAEHARAQAARVLGAVEDPELQGYLVRLMDDPSPLVTVEAIRSAGRVGDLRHVDWLLEKAGDSACRPVAREALVRMGPRVIPAAMEAFDDTTVDTRVRLQIPTVLAGIHDQASVDSLMARAATAMPPLHMPVLKGLSKLRARAHTLRFDESAVRVLLNGSVRSAYELDQIRATLRQLPASPEAALLHRALSERSDRKIDELFRLLALCLPPRDIYNAYLGVVSTRKAVRGSALEFLDNVLDRELKADLFPLLDPDGSESADSAAQRLGVSVEGITDGLSTLIRGRDRWLCACALHYVALHDAPGVEGSRNEEPLRTLAARFIHDADPVVAEAASLAVET